MRSLVQWSTAAMLAALLGVVGCNSCEQTPEPPLPVPQEGRLPRAPQPVATMGTPVVAAPSCAVVISTDVEDGPAPLEIRFTAEGMCTDADGEFTWDFGDGSPAEHEPNVVHVYQKPGSYTAHVSLVDKENNASDKDEMPVNVLAP